MPELPEVETVRIGLAALLPGKVIKGATFDWDKSFPNADADVQQFLIGARIVSVARRAKVLLIELSSKYSLVIHLKMTGQLVFRSNDDHLRFGAGHPSGSLVGRLPDKSTRVVLDLGDSKLFFNDQRKFGWIKLLPTDLLAPVLTGSVLGASARKQRAVERAVQESTVSERRSDDAAIAQERRQVLATLEAGWRGTEALIDFMKRLGPEPLSADFTQAEFRARLKRRANTNIKAALLDQSVIAGVGNIYADESLWGAKIHPATLVKNISVMKLNKLYDSLREVLELSIEKGGSTDRNYVDAQGRKGSYLKFANVFRRNGQPCPRHPDTLIQKIRVAGRGTHFCPKCQKLR